MVHILNAKDAVAKVSDGMTIMVGGFLAYGTAEELVDELVRKDVGGLTLITTDTAYPGRGVGKLIDGRRVKKLYASYI
ncbi:MAG: CoA-transferase, partial [Treponemataceae bacterium]